MEMTPVEAWIVIAIIAIVAVVAIVRKRRADREWEEMLRQKDEQIVKFKDFFARYKKEHPEIWDENGNLYGLPKTKD